MKAMTTSEPHTAEEQGWYFEQNTFLEIIWLQWLDRTLCYFCCGI